MFKCHFWLPSSFFFFFNFLLLQKIQQKFTSNPNQFATLQNMVLHEVQAKQSHLSNSATTAILWLKRYVFLAIFFKELNQLIDVVMLHVLLILISSRTLEFTREFIREYQSGTDDITLVVNTAYVKTLKDFHGWVVRGVFAVSPTIFSFHVSPKVVIYVAEW